MGFLTPLLLAGAGLVAIPIAIHLIMRRQPRELVFPALRFVRARRDANRRRLRLRHWLLLALRCLLVAGLAAALARPTLKGSGLRGKEGVPLAASVVVDNSLRMQYVHQNRTRLEQATEAAAELVGKLPEDAAIAISDLGRAASGLAPDHSAATSRLRNMRTAADARPLAVAVVETIRQTAEQEDRRQEVFVFTDLTAGAWTEEGLKQINDALAEAPDVRLFVVDCGVAAPQNGALGALEIPRSVLRAGEPLHVEVPLRSNLKGANPLVELSLQSEEGPLAKRDQRIAAVGDGGQARVGFDVPDLPLGVHQGVIELTAVDPLEMDNRRYFTIEVRPPARVLLLAAARADAMFVRRALVDQASRFVCEVVPFAEADQATFDKFQAVLLLDPGALADDLWNRLWEYASGGGGVGIFLGHRGTELRAANSTAAEKLLPGRLKRISRDATYLRPKRLDHPALAGMRNWEVPWQVCEVYSFWQFEGKPEDAYVVAAYANDEPAIYERSAGRGRLLTVTTPFSDPLEPEGRETWNVLPREAWPFVAICDELVGYLAQDANERLDYVAGETARVRLPPNKQVGKYVLRGPNGQAESRVAATGEEELSIGATDALGNYRITAGSRAERIDRGFSVNAAPELSELTRVEPTALTEALPKDRVRVAENLDDVEQYVDVGRSGQELFPWAIGLVALVWGTEHLLANRFYREAKTRES